MCCILLSHFSDFKSFEKESHYQLITKTNKTKKTHKTRTPLKTWMKICKILEKIGKGKSRIYWIKLCKNQHLILNESINSLPKFSIHIIFDRLFPIEFNDSKVLSSISMHVQFSKTRTRIRHMMNLELLLHQDTG